MITTVKVAGMMTEHCKRAVFTSLTAVEGIIRADVQLGIITIEHDGSTSLSSIEQAIAVAGYTVTGGNEDSRQLPVV